MNKRGSVLLLSLSLLLLFCSCSKDKAIDDSASVKETDAEFTKPIMTEKASISTKTSSSEDSWFIVETNSALNNGVNNALVNEQLVKFIGLDSVKTIYYDETGNKIASVIVNSNSCLVKWDDCEIYLTEYLGLLFDNGESILYESFENDSVLLSIINDLRNLSKIDYLSRGTVAKLLSVDGCYATVQLKDEEFIFEFKDTTYNELVSINNKTSGNYKVFLNDSIPVSSHLNDADDLQVLSEEDFLVKFNVMFDALQNKINNVSEEST